MFSPFSSSPGRHVGDITVYSFGRAIGVPGRSMRQLAIVNLVDDFNFKEY